MFGLGSTAPKKTSGKCWVTEPDAYIEPVIGQTGFAAVPPTTVIDVFQSCVAKHGDKKALFLRRTINVSTNCNRCMICFSCLFLDVVYVYLGCGSSQTGGHMSCV